MAAEVITYLPATPEGLPLVGALYVHRGMNADERRRACLGAGQSIQRLAPGRLVSRLPEPGTPGTLLWVCHSPESAAEAISVADARPVIAWAWLLDEVAVVHLEERMPVVFGAQNTTEAKARLAALVPSQPDPEGTGASGVCAVLDHVWGIGALSAGAS